MIYINLEPPHGFLIWKGKQKALANDEPLPVGQPILIISNGEAYGKATLSQPVMMSITEFERGEATEQHCVRQLERKMWWPRAKALCSQLIVDWQPFEQPRLIEIVEGQPVFVSKIDELTEAEKTLLNGVDQLPKTIPLIDKAVAISCPAGEAVIIDPALNGIDRGKLEQILQAAYPGTKAVDETGDNLPIYSLALVRQPRLRIERGEKQGDKKKEVVPTQEKQMPYNKIETDDGWCVVNEETGEPVHCYEGDGAEGKADRLLTALRANVEGEEEKQGDKGADGMIAVTPEFLEAKVLEVIGRAMGSKPGEFPGLEKIVTSANQPDDNLTESPPEPDGNLTEPSQKQFDDSSWNGAASQWDTAEAYCRDCLVDVNPGGEDKIKDLCFLPYRKPGGSNPNRSALQAIAGGRGITRLERPDDISDSAWTAALKKAANQLIGWWPEAFEREAPESIFRIAGKTRPAEKAGSRLRQSMVDKLQEAWDTLGKLVQWALYEDNQPEPIELDMLGGMMDETMFDKSAGAMTIKAADGKPWHIVWASNGFKDREGEIVSTKALEDFVSENEGRKGKGFFNYWHIPGTDFARKEWQGVIGRFLVEAGPYLDTAVGQAFEMFFKRYPDHHPEIAPEGWGASIEFMFLPEERDTGIYKTVHIDRTSTLPRFAAANIWTRSTVQEFEMNDKQRESLETILGKEQASKIIALSEKKTEELEQAGVEHKQAGETATQPPPAEATEETPATETATEETAPATVDFSLEDIVNAVVGKLTTDVAQPLAEGLNIVAGEMKSINDRLTAVEKDRNLQKQVEVPRFRFNLQDLQASKAKETTVEENDDLANQQPKINLSQQDGSMAASYFAQK